MKIVRRAVLACLPLAALAMMAGGASAQNPAGRSGHSTGAEAGNVRAFTELNVFGRCFVRSNRVGALSLIATAPGSREEGELFDRLVLRDDEVCMSAGSRVVSSMVYLRGAIAEALVETRVELPAELRQLAPAVAEVRDLSGVALCYTTGHRAEVQALLDTPAGGPQELAAVTALWGAFRQCFPPNFNVRLNAQWIRYLLAEALFRLPPAAPAAS